MKKNKREKKQFTKSQQKSRSPHHPMLFAPRFDSFLSPLHSITKCLPKFKLPNFHCLLPSQTPSTIISHWPESLQFLDFSTIPLYQRPSGSVNFLAPLTEGKTGMDLEPGDRMKACLSGMNITLVVVVRAPSDYSLPYTSKPQYFDQEAWTTYNNIGCRKTTKQHSHGKGPGHPQGLIFWVASTVSSSSLPSHLPYLPPVLFFVKKNNMRVYWLG